MTRPQTEALSLVPFGPVLNYCTVVFVNKRLNSETPFHCTCDPKHKFASTRSSFHVSLASACKQLHFRTVENPVS